MDHFTALWRTLPREQKVILAVEFLSVTHHGSQLLQGLTEEITLAETGCIKLD